MTPALVRLRLGEDQALHFRSYRPHRSAQPNRETHPSPLKTALQPENPVNPISTLGYKPVIALVEAVPVSADDLAAAVIRALEASGLRCGAVSLDGQGRLAQKLGLASRPPAWLWKQNAPELVHWQGARAIIAGPAQEEEVDPREYQIVVSQLGQELDCLVLDLGCRWNPRLFRTLLPMATHIWVVTRPGQWSGVEMRIEQAEFSGWTDMTRVRVLQIGAGSVPALNLGAPLGGVLPDLQPERVHPFVAREVGRKPS